MKVSPLHVQRMAALLSKSNDIVACNIYVSAGRQKHAEPLLNLLQSSQDLCRQIRTRNTEPARLHNRIAIVHAYADGPYDRSSFHLAGHADCVAQVASHLAIGSVDALAVSLLDTRSTNNSNDEDDDEDNTGESNSKSKHPLVGLVDHVSIMPLSRSPSATVPVSVSVSPTTTSSTGTSTSIHQDNPQSENEYVPPDAHGMAALSIADKLTHRGVQCYPYGTADVNNAPLAIVRKQKTSFFNSGGLSEYESATSTSASTSATSTTGTTDAYTDTNANTMGLGICTIGSTPNFVENFNIRLTSNVSKKQAMTLTKKVRFKDGGVIGVEALTLPYSEERYEVACNLLHPDVGSVESILKKMEEWIEEQQQQGDRSREYYIDEAYRVGTTLEQCTGVLDHEEEGFKVHDAEVLERFRIYLGG